MNLRSYATGAIVVLVLSVLFYAIYQSDRKEEVLPTFDEQLLVIEDSIYQSLSETEIQQLQAFAQRAANATDGPSLYSPHAKYLENGAILTYMMFVNKTGKTVTQLHDLQVKMISGGKQPIASATFPNQVKNMPPIAPDSLFLFALIFQPDTVHNQQADLSAYITDTQFEYITAD